MSPKMYPQENIYERHGGDQSPAWCGIQDMNLFKWNWKIGKIVGQNFPRTLNNRLDPFSLRSGRMTSKNNIFLEDGSSIEQEVYTVLYLDVLEAGLCFFLDQCLIKKG